MDNMPRKEEQSQQQLPLTTNVLSTTSNDVLPLSDDMMLDVEMETDTVVATAASPIPVATAVINLTPAEISQPQSHQQPLFKNNIGDIDAPFIKPPHTPIDR